MDNNQFEELCKKLENPEIFELNLEYSVFDGDPSRLDRFVGLLKNSNIKWINLKMTNLDTEGVVKLLKAMQDRGGSTTHINIVEGFTNEEKNKVAHAMGMDLERLGGKQIRNRKGHLKEENVQSVETNSSNMKRSSSAKQELTNEHKKRDLDVTLSMRGKSEYSN